MATLTARKRPLDLVMTAVAGLSLLSLVDALFNYFVAGDGINGTEGALLVIVSTVLMLLAAGILAGRWGPGWLRGILEVLLVLDFIGTAAAAYFLNAWVLLALVVLAALAWAAHLASPANRLPHTV